MGAEDELIKKKVEAKNSFENYCFQMKNTLNEEKLKEAFTEDEKKTIEDCSKEGLQWLESNQDADADAIEGKQKELEAKFNPIMMRVYQATGGAPGGMPGGCQVVVCQEVVCQEVQVDQLDQLKVSMTLTERSKYVHSKIIAKTNRYKSNLK